MPEIPNQKLQKDDQTFSPKPFRWTERFCEARKKLAPVVLWSVVAGALTGGVGSFFRLGVYWLLNLNTLAVKLHSALTIPKNSEEYPLGSARERKMRSIVTPLSHLFVTLENNKLLFV
jgi:hypothetical protein